MEEIRQDAEGGINAFIREQGQLQGEAWLTLVQFDTEYEFVHRGIPVRNAPPFELRPRGMTALLDAVGRAINETAERLNKLSEPQRPGLVLFVVMTDGLENSSKEFGKTQIRQLVEKHQSEHRWHFTFLGADQDAFAEAGALGIAAGATANFSKQRSRQAFEMTSRKAARMRMERAAGNEVDNAFTDEEREEMS